MAHHTDITKVSPLLTQFATGALPQMTDFVAMQAAPVSIVQSETGVIPVSTVDNWLRDSAHNRAYGVKDKHSDVEETTTTFTCQRKSDSILRDYQMERTAQRALPWPQVGVAKVMSKLLLDLEKAANTAMFATSTWGDGTDASVSGGNWDSQSDAEIEADIRGMKNTIRKYSAVEPNAALCNAEVLMHMLQDPGLRHAIGGYGGGDRNLTVEQLKAFFGLDYLFISKAIRNSAAEGATRSNGYVFSDHFLLYSLPTMSNMGLRPLSAQTFVQELDGSESGSNPFTIRQYLKEEATSEVIAGDLSYSVVLTGAEFGKLLPSVIS